MSLQYNILWVDDRKDEYQTLEIDKELENYLNELFFEPHIYMYENVEEAEKNLSQIKYDVIFSDYNIGENKNGKDFIIDIRKLNVKAEILFYSAQEKPPATEMDRISFLQLQSNTAYEELKDKMKSVIDLTVEKLNDLTNLRGLVMSEASELDMMMEEIIKKYYLEKESNSKEWLNFQKRIIAGVEKNTKKKILPKVSKTDKNEEKEHCVKDCFHIWSKAESIEDIISEFEFDSSKKAHTIHIIAEEIFDYKIFTCSEYETEIIQVRNNLAHSKSVIKDGVEVLVTKKKGDIDFNQDSFIKIRRNIKRYLEIFEKIEKKIREK